MSESITHKELKLKAKKIFIKENFKEDQIQIDTFWFTSQPIGLKEKKFRTDVYAGDNLRKKCAECGNFPDWKQPYYYAFFGEKNVIHLPYPFPLRNRYSEKDLREDTLTSEQKKQFLIDIYKKYVYEEFKRDDVYEFEEFIEKDREIFNIDNHKGYREFNPDWGNKSEVQGHNLWMNFPTPKIVVKQDYMKEIHMGMIYHKNNLVIITIFFSGKEPCEKFTSLSESHHKKIFDVLKSLPPGFILRHGFSFWKDKPRLPLDKKWNDPIQCNELTWEDYSEMISDLVNLCDSPGQNVGPVLDLVKIYLTPEDIPAIMNRLKPLYQLLLAPETRTEELTTLIINLRPKWMEDFCNHQENEIYTHLIKEARGNINRIDFKRACKKLKENTEYQEFINKQESKKEYNKLIQETKNLKTNAKAYEHELNNEMTEEEYVNIRGRIIDNENRLKNWR